MNPKKRTHLFLGILLVTWFILVGVPLNPFTVADQVWRRISPSSLIDADSKAIAELDRKFQAFIRPNEQSSKDSNIQVSLDSETAEVKNIEWFILNYIEYRSDFNQYLAFDYLSKDIEIIRAGYDDCDGYAILAASLLLHRGFDAWVLVAPRHFWVEVILNSGSTLPLFKESARGWYLKFNGTQTRYHWSLVMGNLIVGTYLALMFLTLLTVIINREIFYHKNIIIIIYLGFIISFFLAFS